MVLIDGLVYALECFLGVDEETYAFGEMGFAENHFIGNIFENLFDFVNFAAIGILNGLLLFNDIITAAQLLDHADSQFKKLPFPARLVFIKIYELAVKLSLHFKPFLRGYVVAKLLLLPFLAHHLEYPSIKFEQPLFVFLGAFHNVIEVDSIEENRLQFINVCLAPLALNEVLDYPDIVETAPDLLGFA